MKKCENIVLAALNAKYIHPCPAVYSLKEYAREYRDRIRICEFTINQRPEEIIEALYRKKPDLLAFSCYIWNITQTLQICRILHILMPEIPVWLGGPEVSFEDGSFLKEHPFITGVMRGEGEKVFRMLMDHYIRGTLRLDDIPGILWRETPQEEWTGNERIREGRSFLPGDLVEMDELPFLYEDLTLFQNRIIYYESSRGCPFSCSYCMSSTEKRVRLRSLDKVFGELAFFMRAGVPQVKFTDRTFNCSPERTRRIWSWLLEHDNGITNFHFEIEANLLDEDLLALLGRMRPGLVQTEIGVQSVNPLTLRAVSRNEDVARILHSAEVIRKNGNMHLHLDLIAGLPYEDYASMRESFRAVYSIHPHELQLGFLKLLKGCGLYRDKEEFGIVSSPFAPYEVLKTRWLSYEDILRLKGVERVLEIYYNSAQYPCTIRALERYFPDPLSLFEELADFCGEKDGTAHSGSRLAQTALLHAFACTLAPEEEKAWNERTVLDLYLRENAKSRPQWAEDPSGMRDQLHSFWEQEERTGNLFPEFRGKRAGTLKRMFHMERFTRICEEAALTTGNETAKKAVKEGLYPALWLLFDYRHRDPVTGNARTLLLAEVADGRIFSL